MPVMFRNAPLRLRRCVSSVLTAAVWALAASPAAAQERIGGERGWYFATWLWRIRGAIDLLTGGVGMRRGRRDPDSAAVGDALDFWRVEAYEPGRRLRLDRCTP